MRTYDINFELDKEISDKVEKMFENNSAFYIESNNLYIDLKELKEQELEIFDGLLSHPLQMIELLNKIKEDRGLVKYILRFKNLEYLPHTEVEELRCKHLDKAVCIKCKSTAITDVRPIIIRISFECPSCDSIIKKSQVGTTIDPLKCACGRRGGFKIISKDIDDYCYIRIEDLKDLSETPTLKTAMCILKNDLINKDEIKKLNPGNSLLLFGILKEVEETKGGAPKAKLEQEIAVLDYEEIEPEVGMKDFTDEDIKEFKNLSKQINEKGLDCLLESFAPEITGYEIEKKALMIKGAQGRNITKSNEVRKKSNYLFIGDPGVAKTVLVKFYHGVIYGSSYISGSGSSAVGITSSIEKIDNGWILKPGVLPMTKEDAIIDEFNLISEDELPKLQEAMSESQVTINKASIHSKLRVSCGVTAIANPIMGEFDISQPLEKQFNLKPQMLNRFDCIFAIRDILDYEKDVEIGKKILGRQDKTIKSKHSTEFLRKFFTYVRNTKEPKNKLIPEINTPNLYGDIRKNNIKKSGKSKINPRFMESLGRLSVGHAKLRGASVVLKKDIDSAYDILSHTYLNLNKQETNNVRNLPKL